MGLFSGPSKEDLQDRIDDLQSRLDDVEDERDALERERRTAEQAKQSLEQRVDEAETREKLIESELDVVRSVYEALMGDDAPLQSLRDRFASIERADDVDEDDLKALQACHSQAQRLLERARRRDPYRATTNQSNGLVGDVLDEIDTILHRHSYVDDTIEAYYELIDDTEYGSSDDLALILRRFKQRRADLNADLEELRGLADMVDDDLATAGILDDIEHSVEKLDDHLVGLQEALRGDDDDKAQHDAHAVSNHADELLTALQDNIEVLTGDEPSQTQLHVLHQQATSLLDRAKELNDIRRQAIHLLQNEKQRLRAHVQRLYGVLEDMEEARDDLRTATEQLRNIARHQGADLTETERNGRVDTSDMRRTTQAEDLKAQQVDALKRFDDAITEKDQVLDEVLTNVNMDDESIDALKSITRRRLVFEGRLDRVLNKLSQEDRAYVALPDGDEPVDGDHADYLRLVKKTEAMTKDFKDTLDNLALS